MGLYRSALLSTPAAPSTTPGSPGWVWLMTLLLLSVPLFTPAASSLIGVRLFARPSAAQRARPRASREQRGVEGRDVRMRLMSVPFAAPPLQLRRASTKRSAWRHWASFKASQSCGFTLSSPLAAFGVEQMTQRSNITFAEMVMHLIGLNEVATGSGASN
jgi:hypothetical protein